MTYRELYDDAGWKLEHGKINGGEFDEMTKPLDEEIRQWIPCSERLPNKIGVYLVTTEEGKVFEYEYNILTVHLKKWSFCRKEIVAWMPLPEPYKKEGEAK